MAFTRDSEFKSNNILDAPSLSVILEERSQDFTLRQYSMIESAQWKTAKYLFSTQLEWNFDYLRMTLYG